MAFLLEVEYPGGERAIATGYPVAGSTLRLTVIPEGPSARYLDEIEVDVGRGQPYPVLRITGGPRRPTVHVDLALDAAAFDRWMEAREAEGWEVRPADEVGPCRVLAVATRDGLTADDLVRHGARVVALPPRRD